MTALGVRTPSRLFVSRRAGFPSARGLEPRLTPSRPVGDEEHRSANQRGPRPRAEPRTEPSRLAVAHQSADLDLRRGDGRGPWLHPTMAHRRTSQDLENRRLQVRKRAVTHSSVGLPCSSPWPHALNDSRDLLARRPNSAQPKSSPALRSRRLSCSRAEERRKARKSWPVQRSLKQPSGSQNWGVTQANLPAAPRDRSQSLAVSNAQASPPKSLPSKN